MGDKLFRVGFLGEATMRRTQRVRVVMGLAAIVSTAACQPSKPPNPGASTASPMIATSATVTAPPIAIASEALITATATRTTPPATPSNTPRATASRTPTVPTETPIPAPTVTPQSLALPAWLRDSQAVLFAGVTTGDSGAIVLLVVAATGEAWSPPPWDISGYFWPPGGNTFGVWLRETNGPVLIDLETGIVSAPTTPIVTALGLEADFSVPLALEVWPPANEAGPWQLVKADSPRESPDGRYELEMGVSPDTIAERSSGVAWSLPAVVAQADLIEAAWSSAGDQLAMVIETGESRPGRHAADQLVVLTAPEWEVVADVPGPIWGSLAWSEDGQALAYDGGSQPCLLSMVTRQTRCINISQPPTGNYVGYIEWRPGHGALSFLYAKYVTETLGVEGGLCLVSVTDGQMTCPTSGLSETEGQAIVGYDWSPDGRYLFITHDTRHPLSDTSIHPISAVLDLGTSVYHVLPTNWEYRALWRPEAMGGP